MTSLSNLTRRDFLVKTACFMSVLMLSGGCSKTPENISIKTGLVQKFFQNPHNAAEIGRYYLSTNPELNDHQKLHQLINDSFGDLDLAVVNDASALKRLLQGKIREDFKLGRVVNLDGWVLSLTEVRLCALLASVYG